MALQKLESVGADLKHRRRIAGRWETVACDLGLSVGTTVRVANGYDPQTPRIRKALGLPPGRMCEVCRRRMEQITFDFTGPDLKAGGIELVLENERILWRKEIARLIRLTAENHEFFTSDDIHSLAEECGLREPHHPNAWGAAFNMAARDGLIAPTGRFAPSERADAHARMVGVWKSNLHGG